MTEHESNGMRRDTGAQTQVSFRTDFPSASMGHIISAGLEPLTWDLELKTDNNDETRPHCHRYRNWWYIKAVNVPTDRPVTLRIKNRGFPYYYRPVYSYDNKTWHFFESAEVSQPKNHTLGVGVCDAYDEDAAEKRARCYLQIRTTFQQSNVWLARFYPYTIADVENFRVRIQASPYVETIHAGLSTQKRPIWLFRIGSKNPDARTVWVHARTHPHETGAAFVVEGLIQYLLSETPAAQRLRSEFTFYIVPLHNPDGVAAGNYRLTPNGVDLERAWKFDGRNPRILLDTAPAENKVLNQYMRQLLDRQTMPVLALNIHSSNEPYDTPLYLIPHFSKNDPDPARRRLWHKQVNFVCALRAAYEKPLFLYLPRETHAHGADFLNDFYPETWWWANAKDQVNAMTLETVYGNGGTECQLTHDDLRHLGKAIGMSLLDPQKFVDAPDSLHPDALWLERR